MIVLGIDPGLKVTGYSLVRYADSNIELIEAGMLKTQVTSPLETRLSDLYSGLDEILNEFKPEAVSVEDLYSHYKHPKTAVIMGHARGVFFLASGLRGIPVFSYSATKIKKSLTGSGHATKEQMIRMICSLMHCPEKNVTPDVADAIAAALCHINSSRYGI